MASRHQRDSTFSAFGVSARSWQWLRWWSYEYCRNCWQKSCQYSRGRAEELLAAIRLHGWLLLRGFCWTLSSVWVQRPQADVIFSLWASASALAWTESALLRLLSDILRCCWSRRSHTPRSLSSVLTAAKVGQSGPPSLFAKSTQCESFQPVDGQRWATSVYEYFKGKRNCSKTEYFVAYCVFGLMKLREERKLDDGILPDFFFPRLFCGSKSGCRLT